MRYTYLAPFAVALVAACHDSPLSPDTAGFLQAAGNGKYSLAATQTAQGVWERRVEYDWTAQRRVSEIHVGHDMRLLPETDRVEILPGQTVWVTWMVDANRRQVSDGIVKGVRGETCVTNSGHSAVSGFAVTEQVMAMGGGYSAVAGASVTVRSEEPLEPNATRCLPYEIAFEASDDVEYRVVAGVSATTGVRVAEAGANFRKPAAQGTREVDGEAWMRDGAYEGVREDARSRLPVRLGRWTAAGPAYRPADGHRPPRYVVHGRHQERGRL